MSIETKVSHFQDINLNTLRLLRQDLGTIVIDVREVWEFDEFNVGGVNIPLGEVHNRVGELTDFTTIFVVCANGSRSKVAAHFYGRTPTLAGKTVYQLKGGILEAED